ncbi:MAG: DUF4258 domain-containing protein [Chloroflexota bacterium]|nr:DUF4258 domain-containing protein [Chloroflexota bacterium]
MRLRADAIRTIEAGERRVHWRTAERLAEALFVSLNDLLQPPLAGSESAAVIRYASIVYTHHAREKTEERSIPETLVRDVLSYPSQVYPNEDVMVAERIFDDGKPWRVVFAEDHASDGLVVRIVSVYRIDRLKVL